jgi:hypothetical protein
MKKGLSERRICCRDWLPLPKQYKSARNNMTGMFRKRQDICTNLVGVQRRLCIFLKMEEVDSSETSILNR